METKKILLGIKEYFLITLGILCYVLGWAIFLVPNNLIGGGVTGIASIVQYATGGAIKMGYTYFVINAGLLIAALFVIGRNFGVKTVYAIILASVGLNVFQGIIPQTFIQSMALDNGKLMSTIMGGIMVGVGIGMSLSQGGSTGGTDIIALMINKYRNISLGRLILFMDVIIILSSLIVPSYTADGQLVPFVQKLTTVVYGLILIAVCTSVLDMYMAGSKQSVQLFVFSKKYKELADAITRDLHRGVTVLEGQGWYTKTEAHVLMVLTRKTDMSMLLRYIKTIDPDAFLSITSVSGVYGKGFDKIKEKAAKQAEMTK
ncbi:MAG: YitT family protein [Bacteroidales bacterium]|nr:YitT family protein [Bacteroidales bacterium]MBP5796401.1 YitT family protein [Bacteroidales bacterium]